MDSNIGYYYETNKKLMSLIGQWPYQKPNEKRPRLILLIIIICNALVFQITHFFVCEDAQCFYETLAPCMLAIVALIKLFTIYFNNHKIKDLTDRLFKNWDMFTSKEELDIMKKYAETGKWYSLAYVYYVLGGIVIFASTSLLPQMLDVVSPLNTSRPVMLIWPAYYFVDEEKYFYYIYCHMLFCLLYGINSIVAHDCMLFVYLEHVCSLFVVIGFRFEHMLYKNNNVKNIRINHPNDMYCKNIMFIVQAHREALQFVMLLESTFSLSFGLQMLMVIVGMSITLVQISIQLQNNLTILIRYLLLIGGQLFHLFCYSFEGQKLINYSSETGDKIYNGSWYEMPVSAQKLLIMVMRKSLEASVFTAGKIYIFSLESFTTVLQTSMSYFTVLTSMSE
ncbi:uncharacterized protein [Anoplolepis gracilipes]|uniref:uncharacterized protein n=1 Tax=Anoplolepis gracilipes TaxID=354296 RepID=UPI003BA0866E